MKAAHLWTKAKPIEDSLIRKQGACMHIETFFQESMFIVSLVAPMDPNFLHNLSSNLIYSFTSFAHCFQFPFSLIAAASLLLLDAGLNYILCALALSRS